MGTDIHPVVQVLREAGYWHTVALDTSPQMQYGEGRTWPLLESRDYTVFAVLANVRNGRGFAGVYTHDPVRPIALPRGLPDDFCKPDPDLFWMGEHDFSWVTLRELLDYDWDQKVVEGGVVTADEYDAWQRSGTLAPTTWCGGASGRSILTVPVEDYLTHREEIRRHATAMQKEVYVAGVRWQRPLRESVPAFVNEILPWLQTLGKPDEVRLVFGFDS